MHADAALYEDWITIWHSEAAALCVDRELHEGMQRAIDAWADHARAVARAMRASHDPPPGPAGPLSPQGPATAHAAPPERDAVIDALHARIAELERRLAGA